MQALGRFGALICVVAVLASAGEARAGMADAEMSCTSVKKKDGYKLKGVIPRDGDSFRLTLHKDGKKRVWSDAAKLVLFTKVSEHLLAFKTAEKGGLTFWARPKTMQVKREGTHREDARFRAWIQTVRFDRADMSLSVELECKYVYEI